MPALWKAFVQFFVSLKLTVALLALSILLVFFATLDQVQLGIWGVQQKWFHSFFVLQDIKGVPVPVFPGGYFIGALLFINLIAAHVYRFRLSWKKSGIFLTHIGLIALLVGELLSGLWQEDFQMRLDEGQSKNYSESYRHSELAVIDASDPKFDDVVAIPQKFLARNEPIQHAKLPFRIVPRTYYPNASVQMRDQVPGAPASPANQGIGSRLVTTPMEVTYKDNERNFPAAVLELIGPEGTLGTWLVSSMLIEPQSFDYAGKTWRLALRLKREYKPYKVTLQDFSHDRYAGTDIPKNFSSKVRLESDDGRTNREVLIYMNNPLRYDGLTFYQAGFEPDDKTTILQVVRNPSWLLPYVSCGLMTLGLLIQFGIHLFAFAGKRRARPVLA